MNPKLAIAIVRMLAEHKDVDLLDDSGKFLEPWALDALVAAAVAARGAQGLTIKSSTLSSCEETVITLQGSGSETLADDLLGIINTEY